MIEWNKAITPVIRWFHNTLHHMSIHCNDVHTVNFLKQNNHHCPLDYHRCFHYWELNNPLYPLFSVENKTHFPPYSFVFTVEMLHEARDEHNVSNKTPDVWCLYEINTNHCISLSKCHTFHCISPSASSPTGFTVETLHILFEMKLLPLSLLNSPLNLCLKCIHIAQHLGTFGTLNILHNVLSAADPLSW